MRLFVAIDIPDQIIEELREIRPDIEGVRWQNAGQLHLTLRFIGDVEEGRVGQIISEFDTISMPSFSMDLQGFGRFPPKGYPRVFWVGVANNDLLMDLQEQIEKTCRLAGLEPDNRPFVPHITLGKVKQADKDEIEAFIRQHREYTVPDISVDKFILYSSTLKSGGAIHTPEKTFSLNN